MEMYLFECVLVYNTAKDTLPVSMTVFFLSVISIICSVCSAHLIRLSRSTAWSDQEKEIHFFD